MGLTDKGYQRRTFEDILNAKKQRAKELFGENIDVSDQGPLGKYLRINAYDQAQLEEENEQVYYSSKPNSATGQSLDRLLPFGGITRNPATAASYSVNVQGTAGYTIEAGFLVGTDTDLTFWTAQDYTISEDGTCLIEVHCTEAGSIGNVSASAINTEVNPDANITSVAGVECLTAGADEEDDATLRARLKTAMTGAGGSGIDALIAALLRIPTVQYATVVENVEATEDADGRPPNSFEAYVQGGDDYHQEIAEAIFSKRSPGIKTVGDIAVAITDICGNERTVKFSTMPPTSVKVKIAVNVTTSFPGNGAELVAQNVVAYINSLGVGKSLVLNSIYSHIYKVAGVTEVTTLELSTDGGSYSTANVTVPSYGLIVCSEVAVEVTTE